jgi:hypothetical protein
MSIVSLNEMSEIVGQVAVGFTTIRVLSLGQYLRPRVVFEAWNKNHWPPAHTIDGLSRSTIEVEQPA